MKNNPPENPNPINYPAGSIIELKTTTGSTYHIKIHKYDKNNNFYGDYILKLITMNSGEKIINKNPILRLDGCFFQAQIKQIKLLPFKNLT